MRALSTVTLPATEIAPTTWTTCEAAAVSGGTDSGDGTSWARAIDAPRKPASRNARSLGPRGDRCRSRLHMGCRCEVQAIVLALDHDFGPGRKLPTQDELRERILQEPLDRP